MKSTVGLDLIDLNEYKDHHYQFNEIESAAFEESRFKTNNFKVMPISTIQQVDWVKLIEHHVSATMRY